MQVRQCCHVTCGDALQQQMNQHIMQVESSIDTFGVNCMLCIYIYIRQLKQANTKLYSYASQLGNTFRRPDCDCSLYNAFQCIAQPETNLHNYNTFLDHTYQALQINAFS